jgi:cell wall-associated NlpC family hydrolase
LTNFSFFDTSSERLPQVAEKLSLTHYALLRFAVAPLRSEPAHRSEMVSQLLFGELVEIQDRQEDWFLVRNIFDNYSGWIPSLMLWPISEDWAHSLQLKPFKFSTQLSQTLLWNHSPLVLPIGCPLPQFHPNGFAWENGVALSLVEDQSLTLPIEVFTKEMEFFSREKDNSKETEQWRQEVIKTALPLLNTPYLWGGRTNWGIDCSGFVQTVFKLNGIDLPRDAYQQAEHGETLGFLEEAQPGDLAFFDNEAGRITHVGILLGQGKIIHASGNVRIDPIDHHGIIHQEWGKRTHRLRTIKNLDRKI